MKNSKGKRQKAKLQFKILKFFTFAFFLFTFALSSCGGSSTTYTVGGTVSGLSGTVVLQNNTADDLTLTADGTFTFATALADAAAYSVTVLTQPTGQTCTVTSGSGTISSANVTNVSVTCVTNYSVGGTLSGLGTSLSVVLQNNTADDLTLSSNGTFTFTTGLASGATYAVTVLTQPTGQTCTVTSGSGTVSANVTDVAVACVYTNKIIFITSSTFDGAIGSIAAADAACAADANKPDAGTYKAMIVDGTARVACTNTGCAGGTAGRADWVFAAETSYYRSDAATLIGLTTSNGVFNLPSLLANSFSTTAYGIWTGLKGDWMSGDTCTLWATNNDSTAGNVGSTDQTNFMAISASAQLCNITQRLACVRQ